MLLSKKLVSKKGIHTFIYRPFLLFTLLSILMVVVSLDGSFSQSPPTPPDLGIENNEVEDKELLLTDPVADPNVLLIMGMPDRRSNQDLPGVGSWETRKAYGSERREKCHTPLEKDCLHGVFCDSITGEACGPYLSLKKWYKGIQSLTSAPETIYRERAEREEEFFNNRPGNNYNHEFEVIHDHHPAFLFGNNPKVVNSAPRKVTTKRNGGPDKEKTDMSVADVFMEVCRVSDTTVNAETFFSDYKEDKQCEPKDCNHSLPGDRDPGPQRLHPLDNDANNINSGYFKSTTACNSLNKLYLAALIVQDTMGFSQCPSNAYCHLTDSANPNINTILSAMSSHPWYDGVEPGIYNAFSNSHIISSAINSNNEWGGVGTSLNDIPFSPYGANDPRCSHSAFRDNTITTPAGSISGYSFAKCMKTKQPIVYDNNDDFPTPEMQCSNPGNRECEGIPKRGRDAMSSFLAEMYNILDADRSLEKAQCEDRDDLWDKDGSSTNPISCKDFVRTPFRDTYKYIGGQDLPTSTKKTMESHLDQDDDKKLGVRFFPMISGGLADNASRAEGCIDILRELTDELEKFVNHRPSDVSDVLFGFYESYIDRMKNLIDGWDNTLNNDEGPVKDDLDGYRNSSGYLSYVESECDGVVRGFFYGATETTTSQDSIFGSYPYFAARGISKPLIDLHSDFLRLLNERKVQFPGEVVSGKPVDITGDTQKYDEHIFTTHDPIQFGGTNKGVRDIWNLLKDQYEKSSEGGNASILPVDLILGIDDEFSDVRGKDNGYKYKYVPASLDGPTCPDGHPIVRYIPELGATLQNTAVDDLTTTLDERLDKNRQKYPCPVYEGAFGNYVKKDALHVFNKGMAKDPSLPCRTQFVILVNQGDLKTLLHDPDHNPINVRTGDGGKDLRSSNAEPYDLLTKSRGGLAYVRQNTGIQAVRNLRTKFSRINDGAGFKYDTGKHARKEVLTFVIQIGGRDRYFPNLLALVGGTSTEGIIKHYFDGKLYGNIDIERKLPVSSDPGAESTLKILRDLAQGGSINPSVVQSVQSACSSGGGGIGDALDIVADGLNAQQLVELLKVIVADPNVSNSDQVDDVLSTLLGHVNPDLNDEINNVQVTVPGFTRRQLFNDLLNDNCGSSNDECRLDVVANGGCQAMDDASGAVPLPYELSPDQRCDDWFTSEISGVDQTVLDAAARDLATAFDDQGVGSAACSVIQNAVTTSAFTEVSLKDSLNCLDAAGQPEFGGFNSSNSADGSGAGCRYGSDTIFTEDFWAARSQSERAVRRHVSNGQFAFFIKDISGFANALNKILDSINSYLSSGASPTVPNTSGSSGLRDRTFVTFTTPASGVKLWQSRLALYTFAANPSNPSDRLVLAKPRGNRLNYRRVVFSGGGSSTGINKFQAKGYHWEAGSKLADRDLIRDPRNVITVDPDTKGGPVYTEGIMNFSSLDETQLGIVPADVDTYRTTGIYSGARANQSPECTTAIPAETDPAYSDKVEACLVKEIKDFMSGETGILSDSPEDDLGPLCQSSDPCHVRMGNLQHSSPKAVGSPSQLVNEPAFSGFEAGFRKRSAVVYVGSNAGGLHAFHAGEFHPKKGDPPSQKRNPFTREEETGFYDAGNGSEIFFYVPPVFLKDGRTGGDLKDFVLDKDKLQQDNAFFDQTPRISDIFIDGYSNEMTSVNCNNVSADGSIDANGCEWHTVLMSGFGNGSKGITALDVTNAHCKASGDVCKVDSMAETTPSDTPADAESTLPYPVHLWTLNDPDFGNSWSSPVISKVKLKASDGTADRWVAFTGGGLDPDTSDATTLGTAFYAIDIPTGKIVYKFHEKNTSLTDADKDRMKCEMASEPGVFDLNSDGYIDTVYAGDTCGQLWRFDVSKPLETSSTLDETKVERNGVKITKGNAVIEASEWKGAVVFCANTDTECGKADPTTMAGIKPIYFPPTVVTDVDARRRVIFQTGNRRNPTENDDTGRLYSFVDAYVPESFRDSTSGFDSLVTTTTTMLDEDDITSTITIDSSYQSDSTSSTVHNSFMVEYPNSGTGEKGMSAPIVLNGLLTFTTYNPFDKTGGASTSSCRRRDIGETRLYGINYITGQDMLQNIIPDPGNNKPNTFAGAVVGEGIGSPPTLSVGPGNILTLQISTTGGSSDTGGAKFGVYNYQLPPNNVETVFWNEII